MLRIALDALPAAQDVAQMHGMAAFGYEECHLFADAEHAARRALEMRRAEPWAQHALAHVMLTQGRIDEGVRFLEGAADTWDGLNSFMVTHNWWHLCLFYLSQGRGEAVLLAYDAHCWAGDRDYSQDQVGAVSASLTNQLTSVQNTQAGLEDVNVATVTTQLDSEMTNYQAAMWAASQAIPETLVHFL